MDQDFKYSNEEDRSYGLAGMAVSVVVWDSERLFNAVDIDAAAGEAMEMTQEFYFSGNPGLSAKAAWESMVEHFQLSTAMMVSNVMCRLYVHRNTQIDAGLRRRMLPRRRRDTAALRQMLYLLPPGVQPSGCAAGRARLRRNTASPPTTHSRRSGRGAARPLAHVVRSIRI